MTDCTSSNQTDWFAHAQERKRAFQDNVNKAAARLRESKLAPPPPPPPIVEEPVPPPPPAPVATSFDKLAAYVPNWRVIQLEVCKAHGLELRDVLLDNRIRVYTLARQEMFYRLRHELGLSLLDIGMRMRRDHTTVMNGIKRHALRLQKGTEPCITKKS